ncbi:glycosyltransferase [Microbacterium sp. USHLN186]|uniref:glycosyltransferase n=1 Tax=Microbacterium sp. USHLN186 TaxID=3081286 RepID=UPI00301A8420
MVAPPQITIVMPVFNDEATVGAALSSAVGQTLAEIEIVCVDDASTDATVAVIERYRAQDSRVRLVEHDRNLSAFQARRTGVMAARAKRLLFLDGDDELAPDAAQKALALAEASDADLVGFGVTVIEKDGRTGGAYERRLQPAHGRLDGPEVLPGLFPIGKPAQGQLWRMTFRTSVLRDAYALLADDLVLPRVNDLPLMFLIAALAESYASTDARLYRYHFGRGGSGHDVDSIERARFYTSAIDSISAIAPAVEGLAARHPDPQLLRDSYESVRLSIIGYVCSQLIDRSVGSVLDASLAHLHTVATAHDIVHAAARFYPRTLSTLKFHSPWQDHGDRPVRSVLLVTSTLRTGGVSAVIASQTHYLLAAGYRVVVVARSAGSDRAAIPLGAEFVELTGRTLLDRLEVWAEIIRSHDVDVVIDHQILYSSTWPEFALMARAEGAATIGWMHNFVGRPIYDGTDRLSLIEQCSGVLARLIVLSPLDASYFSLRGVEHVAWVPNPPSPLLLESAAQTVDKQPPRGRIELLWWGRLEQHTKQVYDLIEVGVQLRSLGVDFRLRVVGPDWGDVTAAKFNARSRRRGVGKQVIAIGPLRGHALRNVIDSADVFVSTSIIEGYQLTIAEAQARGLPVVMYALPWLSLVQGNEGVLSVPQGDARELALCILDLVSDPERYRRVSAAAQSAAARAVDYDFARLYQGVVTGTLPSEFSPQPTQEDARQLLGLLVFFAERVQRRHRVVASTAGTRASRAWKSAAPAGRAVLKLVPALRPLAHRAKAWLGAG